MAVGYPADKYFVLAYLIVVYLFVSGLIRTEDWRTRIAVAVALVAEWLAEHHTRLICKGSGLIVRSRVWSIARRRICFRYTPGVVVLPKTSQKAVGFYDKEGWWW